MVGAGAERDKVETVAGVERDKVGAVAGTERALEGLGEKEIN